MSPTRRRQGPLQYLASRTLLGVKFGLTTIRELMDALGHPERRFASILIGGTNGKGSVVAYVDAALRASGLRTARYTSPHLIRVHERITVNGAEISTRELAEAITRVRDAAETLVRAGRLPGHPTYFEVVTAVALDHFGRSGVEVAVLEVGMGARLDATSVCDPVVSAIVTVERDHEAYLGHTLDAIAREKAGVLRAGRPTVLGALAPEARRAIDEVASTLGARLVDAHEGSQVRAEAEALCLRTPQREYRLGIQLPAAHQRHNALVAARVLEEAHAAGIGVNLEAVATSLAGAHWPGRLEWIPGDPPLLLDGAHNPAAARALADYLRPRGPVVLLFGIMGDKDIPEVTRVLFPLAESIVVTRARDERAARPAEIVRRAGALASHARRQSNPRKALALARSLARPGQPVVVAGSLYLVGEVLRIVSGSARP